MSVIETHELTKHYNSFPALDGVTLEIPKGITGIVGANGAGKTTLLKILLGITAPTSGSASIFGEEIGSPQVRQLIGYMSELDSFFPDVSAKKFIAHLGQMSGLPRTAALQRAHDILQFVGLGEERHRKIQTFSKGMLQKMKLGQALVHSPKLLLLDEPTDGLDPEGRARMLRLTKKLHDEGINILISTHILPDIQRTAGHLVVIHKGKLLLSNNLSHILQRFERKLVGEFEVRDKTTLHEFTTTLSGKGFQVRPLQHNRYEIVMPNGSDLDYESVHQAAIENNIHINSLARHTFTLDEAFIDMFSEDTGFRTGLVPGRGA